jgi:hypothetical protein
MPFFEMVMALIEARSLKAERGKPNTRFQRASYFSIGLADFFAA